MPNEVKKSFWSRLFSGNTEQVEPQADANGVVSFSTEQFTTLTNHLEGWETVLEGLKVENAANEAFKAELVTLTATVQKHSAQFAKLATTPGVAPVASTVEPVAVADQAVSVDPVDAQLKAAASRYNH